MEDDESYQSEEDDFDPKPSPKNRNSKRKMVTRKTTNSTKKVTKRVTRKEENVDSDDMVDDESYQSEEDDFDFSNNTTISRLGWSFLFLNQTKQLWILLKAYVELHNNKDTDELEVVSLLLTIAFWTLGKGDLMSSLTAASKQMIIHWTELGIAYRPDGMTFFPTHLASKLLRDELMCNVTDDESNSNCSAKSEGTEIFKEGYIILENNFHLYAYTSSPIKIQTISLFAEVMYTLPNMITGVITRNSILGVLRKGVASMDIIAFLKDHFHPKMARVDPGVIQTVTDQIELWASERDRISFSSGVLYDNFVNFQEFNEIRQYAMDLGVVIWENPEKRYLFVKEDAHPVIREFIKSLRR
eukprot:TRINITY_DN1115_c0_g1_i5.p1 TRINITY_DN1115_c0_g1~~TRINITY_DN1115_c0_g1_i5.p1  ORF type:complete len:357 (+),score=86.57 TRINITY_DN1115_c0_g1_i5:894-1964(+)